MAEGRHTFAWDHTATIVAKLHNVHVAKGKKVDPLDIHPYREKDVSNDVRSLKGIW